MNDFMKSIIVENHELAIQDKMPRMALPDSYFPIFGKKNQQNQGVFPQIRTRPLPVADSKFAKKSKKPEYVLSPFENLSADKRSELFGESDPQFSK